MFVCSVTSITPLSAFFIMISWCAPGILFCRTILEFADTDASGTVSFFMAVGRFCLMFFASAGIGICCGLLSALVYTYMKKYYGSLW